jgi:hypothetical protein
MAWKLCRICSELRAWPVAMQEVIWSGSFNFITFLSLEPFPLCRVHIQMRSLKSLIFFVVIDDVRNCLLLNKASLIDCILGEVWLYYMELAKMPPTIARITQTWFLIMMGKIAITQFRGSLSKFIRTWIEITSLRNIQILGIPWLVEIISSGLSTHSRFHLSLKGWFLCWRRTFSLRKRPHSAFLV